MLRVSLLSCLLALPVVTLAEQPADLSLEPCINGEVSRLGSFPSQEMEEASHAYLEWRARSGSSYYLFKVAPERLSLMDATE